MPFLGELKQATAYNINVDCGTVTGNKTAVTVEKINKRDKVQAAETYTIAAGARQAITDTFGARIDRVIIQVHPPVGGQASIEVVQGNAAFQQSCAGDTELVFDTVP